MKKNTSVVPRKVLVTKFKQETEEMAPSADLKLLFPFSQERNSKPSQEELRIWRILHIVDSEQVNIKHFKDVKIDVWTKTDFCPHFPEFIFGSLKYTFQVSIPVELFPFAKDLAVRLQVVDPFTLQEINSTSEMLEGFPSLLSLTKQVNGFNCCIKFNFLQASHHHSQKSFAFILSINDCEDMKTCLVKYFSPSFKVYARRIIKRKIDDVTEPTSKPTKLRLPKLVRTDLNEGLNHFSIGVEWLSRVFDSMNQPDKNSALDLLKKRFGVMDLSYHEFTYTPLVKMENQIDSPTPVGDLMAFFSSQTEYNPSQ